MTDLPDSVVDATEDLELHVRRRDVDKGQARIPNACPIAQALYRKFGQDAEVSVGSEVVLVHPPGKPTVRYLLKGEMQRRVYTFDEARYFEPGLIRLSAPTGTRRLGHKKQDRPTTDAQRQALVKRRQTLEAKKNKNLVNKTPRQPLRHVAMPDRPATPGPFANVPSDDITDGMTDDELAAHEKRHDG